MAGRSQAFIRGLYANAQNQSFNSLARRTGVEALTALEHRAKRKRDEEERSATTPTLTPFGSPQPCFLSPSQDPPGFDAELRSFLFDNNNKCIFEDEGLPPTAVITDFSNEMKRCRLSPSCAMQVQVPSKAVTHARNLVQVAAPVPRLAVPAPRVFAKAKPPVRKRTHKERVKKNSRERVRRAGMGTKFKELYDLVCSGMVASAITDPASSTMHAMQQHRQAEIERQRKMKVAKPSKVLVLSEAIKTISSLEKELNDLKKLNSALKAS